MAVHDITLSLSDISVYVSVTADTLDEATTARQEQISRSVNTHNMAETYSGTYHDPHSGRVHATATYRAA